MRKIGITLLFMLNSLIALSEIGIKIFEPIRFKEVNEGGKRYGKDHCG